PTGSVTTRTTVSSAGELPAARWAATPPVAPTTRPTSILSGRPSRIPGGVWGTGPGRGKRAMHATDDGPGTRRPGPRGTRHHDRGSGPGPLSRRHRAPVPAARPRPRLALSFGGLSRPLLVPAGADRQPARPSGMGALPPVARRRPGPLALHG